MSTGLPRPGSAHRGRIKLLRGYVSNSNSALNPLTITQLACERPRGRSRTALRGPVHQLEVHGHAYNNINNYYARNLRAPMSTEILLIFKRNHVAAASQQKQVLVRLTGILQTLLIYKKRVQLLMELTS